MCIPVLDIGQYKELLHKLAVTASGVLAEIHKGMDQKYLIAVDKTDTLENFGIEPIMNL